MQESFVLANSVDTGIMWGLEMENAHLFSGNKGTFFKGTDFGGPHGRLAITCIYVCAKCCNPRCYLLYLLTEQGICKVRKLLLGIRPIIFRELGNIDTPGGP